MKKLNGFGLWSVMAGAMIFAVGCHMGPVPSTAEQQSSMMKQLPTQTSAPQQPLKAVNVQNPTLKTDTTLLKDPMPLFPKGVWKGTYTPVNNGEEAPMTLTLRQRQKAQLAPKPKRSLWSTWSWIRSAHACGPYAPAITAPLEGEWNLNGSAPTQVSFTGEAQTHDGYRRNVSFGMQSKDSMYLSGSIYKDAKTGKIILRGSVMKKDNNRYTALGRFVLTRHDS